jgi:hypothetical protein
MWRHGDLPAMRCERRYPTPPTFFEIFGPAIKRGHIWLPQQLAFSAGLKSIPCISIEIEQQKLTDQTNASDQELEIFHVLMVDTQKQKSQQGT